MDRVWRLFSLVDLSVVGGHHSLRDRLLVLKHEVVLVINLRSPSIRYWHLSIEGHLVRHNV